MKECPQCAGIYELKDFLIHKTCYKCTYKNKVGVPTRGTAKKAKTCRECKKKLPRGKWVFCSYECAKQGHITQRKEYWTRKLRSHSEKWQKNVFRYHGPNYNRTEFE